MTEAQQRYRIYLQSEHWSGLRLEAFKKYGRRCSKCPMKHSLEVHHTIYRHPWELGTVEDLVILCFWCHRAEHAPVLRIVPDAVRRTAQKKRPRRKRHRRRLVDMAGNEKRIAQINRSQWHYTKPYSVKRRWSNRGSSSN